MIFSFVGGLTKRVHNEETITQQAVRIQNSVKRTDENLPGPDVSKSGGNGPIRLLKQFPSYLQWFAEITEVARSFFDHKD